MTPDQRTATILAEHAAPPRDPAFLQRGQAISGDEAATGRAVLALALAFRSDCTVSDAVLLLQFAPTGLDYDSSMRLAGRFFTPIPDSIGAQRGH